MPRLDPHALELLVAATVLLLVAGAAGTPP